MESESTADLIFHEGDHSSLFYLVVLGDVAPEVMSSGHPVRVSTLVAGGFRFMRAIVSAMAERLVDVYSPVAV